MCLSHSTDSCVKKEASKKLISRELSLKGFLRIKCKLNYIEFEFFKEYRYNIKMNIINKLMENF